MVTQPGLFTDDELRPCSECRHEGSSLCEVCKKYPCNKNACWRPKESVAIKEDKA